MLASKYVLQNVVAQVDVLTEAPRLRLVSRTWNAAVYQQYTLRHHQMLKQFEDEKAAVEAMDQDASLKQWAEDKLRINEWIMEQPEVSERQSILEVITKYMSLQDQVEPIDEDAPDSEQENKRRKEHNNRVHKKLDGLMQSYEFMVIDQFDLLYGVQNY